MSTKVMSMMVLEHPTGTVLKYDKPCFLATGTAIVRSVSCKGLGGAVRGLRLKGWVPLCQGAGPLSL